MADPTKIQPLTIYLAKEAFTKPLDVVKDPDGLKHHAIGGGASVGDLYIPLSAYKQPKWARFFTNYVPPDAFGQLRSAGALFTTVHKNRVFAFTFGTGRFLLKQDCWEDRFGLRVALNCIGDNTVKSIDKHTLDPLAKHTREQASREATAGEFGLDIEQDLLRGVTGTPKEEGFGKWITGMDSLHIAVPVTIEDLPELLERIYVKSLDTSYQKIFPWVDQIAEIRDSTLQAQLTGLLVDRLRSGDKDNTWMAVPEVIPWETVGGFRFPAPGPRVEYHDVHLDHFVASLKAASEINEDLLKTRIVECLDREGNLLQKWKAYRCLYSELDYKGDAYLLSGGSWYRVKRAFVDQINASVNQIPEYDYYLPEFDDHSEGHYVKRVAKAAPTSLAAMDGKTVVYGGGASKVEFCDLLTAKHDLIHIKRYGQSAALSHLFAQGLTSGELLQIDPDFRKALNAKLPAGYQLSDPTKRPKQHEYRVVFAIVSDRPGSLTLPFFSRLNLKHAARRLEGYGFRVAKAKIPVAELRAKLKKIKRRKQAA
jgi:uncharacterized protein (TIGR04141 family)